RAAATASAPPCPSSLVPPTTVTSTPDATGPAEAAGFHLRAASGTVAPVTRLTRRQALLAGVVPLLGAVAGCDTPNGDQGPAQTATTTAPGGQVRSGLVAFGDFGGGPAQPAVAAAMERRAARHPGDALVPHGGH